MTKYVHHLKEWFWNLISCGLQPDTDVSVLRKLFLLNLIILLGIAFLFFSAILAFVQKDYLLSMADFFVILFLLLLFYYLRRTKKSDAVSKIGMVVCGLFYFFLIAHGGVDRTAYVWVFTYPMISFFLLGAWMGSIFSFLLLGMICIVFFFGDKFAFFTSYRIDLVLRIIPTYITIVLSAFIMEKVRHITQNRLHETNSNLAKSNNEKDKLILQLKRAIGEIETLQGIIPICSSCKKIRDDKGYWNQIESYIQKHSEAEFSHSMCPECSDEFYGKEDWYIKMKKKKEIE